jgi:hypothetical protein
MSRFGRRRARQRGGWRSTASRGRSRPGRTVALPLATMQPDEESRLSDGVLVETALVARVLGLRLLRVDGTVLLAPARLHERRADTPTTTPPSLPTDGAELEPGLHLVEARRLLRTNGERLRLLR